MPTTKRETLAIRSGNDVVQVRQVARAWSSELKLSLIEQTKLVTAASELARNTLEHGGGGEVTLEMITELSRRGLRLTFEDKGKGIPNLELALKDGYTTGGGMGLGLGGARRLVQDFQIQSTPGAGTKITITKWV